MDEWRKFNPRSLFTAKDGSPICAILDMKDRNAARITKKMFEDRGGSIILNSPNPFTIFLTDRHSTYTAGHLKCPLFNVRWIFDCIDSVELININPYLMNKDSFKCRDFKDVIFEKLETLEGTLLVENQYETSEDDWKRNSEEPPGKHTQRRGPPKKYDHVLLEVDRLSQEDDFNSQLAMSVVTEAIESILLNERALISKTKDELKRHDPEFENVVFKHKHNIEGTSWILLNSDSLSSTQCERSISCHIATDDELNQSPTLSTSGAQDCEDRTTNQTSSNPKSSGDTQIAMESSNKEGSDSKSKISSFPKRLQKFSNTTKLRCSANVLLVSSRVGEEFSQDFGET